MSFNNTVLQYSNRAVYPIYILHQTVLIAVGYDVLPFDGGIFVKYGIIVACTFLATLIIYETIVRRSRLTRLVFGLK